jgi:hypothetical protein
MDDMNEKVLRIVVAGLGVVLVLMMAALVVGLARRGAPKPVLAADAVLSEPAGTHIAGISAVGGDVAVQLQGGGPDRVVLLNPQGRVTARVVLQAK